MMIDDDGDGNDDGDSRHSLNSIVLTHSNRAASWSCP